MKLREFDVIFTWFGYLNQVELMNCTWRGGSEERWGCRKMQGGGWEIRLGELNIIHLFEIMVLRTKPFMSIYLNRPKIFNEMFRDIYET